MGQTALTQRESSQTSQPLVTDKLPLLIIPEIYGCSEGMLGVVVVDVSFINDIVICFENATINNRLIFFFIFFRIYIRDLGIQRYSRWLENSFSRRSTRHGYGKLERRIRQFFLCFWRMDRFVLLYVTCFSNSNIF